MAGQPPLPDWLPPLETGERLLWDGRPDTALVWPKRHRTTLFFGLIFGASTLFFLGLSLAYQTTLLLPVAGFFGLFTAGFTGIPMWIDRQHRAGSRYAVTSKQAITRRAGKVEYWPLGPENDLSDTKTGIDFATERVPSRFGWRNVPMGFSRLGDETEKVQALIRQVVRDNASA